MGNSWSVPIPSNSLGVIPSTLEHRSRRILGDHLVVQGLRLRAPNAGGLGLISGQGTRSHKLQLRSGAAQLKTNKQTNLGNKIDVIWLSNVTGWWDSHGMDICWGGPWFQSWFSFPSIWTWVIYWNFLWLCLFICNTGAIKPLVELSWETEEIT